MLREHTDVVLIAIMVSSLIGLFMGIVQVAVFDTSWAGGVLTYFTVSITLSTLAIIAAALRSDDEGDVDHPDSTLAQWQDWHDSEDWRDAELSSPDVTQPRKAAGGKST